MSTIIEVAGERQTFRGMTMERHVTIETRWFVVYYDYIREGNIRSLSLRWL